MTTGIQSLSDKILIMNLNPVIHGIDPEEVKEFIKKLKDKIDNLDIEEECSIQDYLVECQNIINKLAGDKLI